MIYFIIPMVYTALSAIVAGVGLWRRHTSRLAGWVAAWCVMVALGNVGGLAVSYSGFNSHFIGHGYMLLATAALAGIALVAFAPKRQWQVAAVIGAVAVGITWTIGVMQPGAIELFPKLSGPPAYLYGTLVGFGMVAMGLRDTTVPPAANAMAWIGVAFVVSHFPTIAINPVAHMLLAAESDALMGVLMTSLVLETIGQIVILLAFTRRGIRWTV